MSPVLQTGVMLNTLFAFFSPTFALPSTHPKASSSNASQLIWTDCSTTYGSGFTCANFTVPVDWCDPDGEKLTLGMSRYQSNFTSSKAKRNLFINYGGPGGITTQILPETLIAFSDEMLAVFDIIAVDPRGIGTSTPLQCDIDLYNERISLFPQTEAEFNKLVQHNKAFAASCVEKSGKLAYHMDTASVAKDFEAVRKATGSAKFNYLGFSYGTYIGYQYAELFPDNLGSIVLDAVANHAESETSMLVTETETYEDEFDRFTAWASKSNESVLAGQDVAALFDSLVQKADQTPLAIGSVLGARTNITGDEILFGFQGALVSKAAGIGVGWPALSQGLALALSGNATALASLAPVAVEGDIEDNSGLFAGVAVGCMDWTHEARDVAAMKYKDQLTTNWAPHTKGHTQGRTIQSLCIGWSAPVNPPKQILLEIKTPILLVNSYHDAECSYTWAVAVQAQIPNSVLLTRDGDGHTSYFEEGETTAAMNAFLINGTMPAQNTVLQT